MVGRVRTVAFSGVEVLDVEAQVTITSGLIAFTVVGLPDKAVAESRERVRAALAGLGLAVPARRITVNLAPADLLKEGSHFTCRSRSACWRRWRCCRARRSPTIRRWASSRSTARCCRWRGSAMGAASSARRLRGARGLGRRRRGADGAVAAGADQPFQGYAGALAARAARRRGAALAARS